MSKRNKISIIGIGKVGSTLAFSIIAKKLADELVLVDYNKDAAISQAQDLLYASPFTHHAMTVTGGDYQDTKDSDIIVVTASVPSKDIKSRLDLVTGNRDLFKQIIPQLAKLSPNSILIIISNPVDVMTYATLKLSGFAPSRVIGTGTFIDSARLVSLISQESSIHPDSINAYILGEHGDSEFAAISCANVGGVSFKSNSPKTTELFEQAKKGGYDVMKYKGFTNYAIALATATLIEYIVTDAHKILPVSTLINGYYNVKDVCLSVPAIVGRQGIIRTLELDLNESERAAFTNSAQTLQQVIHDAGL